MTSTGQVAVPEVPIAPATRPGRPRETSPRPLLELALIAVPAVLGTVLVFHAITARSLWLDEAATVAIASQHGSALGAAIAHDGGNMLAYYAVMHALLGLFGHSTLVIRIPSALATAVTVAIVCLIGRRLFGRWTALAAGLLTAVSLPLVFWGQDARAYAPMMAFVAGSFLAFIGLVDRDHDSPVPKWTWLAYVLATVLAVYMSFVAALVVPAQLLSLYRRRRRLRPVAVALVPIIVCCIPLMVLAARRGSSQLFWVPGPNLTAVQRMLEWLTSSGMEPNFHPTATGGVLLAVSIALLALVVVAAIASRSTDRRASWPLALMLCWLLVPSGLSLLESVLGQPVDLARNSLVSLPAVSLVLAAGISDRRLAPWIGWSTLGVLLALRALALAPGYGTSPENWRAATADVLTRTLPGDCIAFYPSDGRMAFDYYLLLRRGGTAGAPRPVLPAAPWSEVRPYVEDYAALSSARLGAVQASCRRLWFVSSHQGQRNGASVSRADYGRYLSLLGTLTSAYPQHATASFGWASPVRVELFAR